MNSPKDGKNLVTNVSRFIQRRVIGAILAICGFAGLLVAESITRALSHDDTYYQVHSWPRFIGAILAAGFSFGALRIAVAILKWQSSGEGSEEKSPKEIAEEDRAVVGRLKYIPYVVLGLCLLAAIIPAD